MSTDIDWQLLDRFLAGDATADETQRVEAWLRADPRRAAMVDGLRARLADETRVDVEGAWRRVAARTVDVERPPAPRTREANPRWAPRLVTFSRPALLLAAGIAVVFLGPVLLLRTERPKRTPPAASTTAMRVVNAPLGSRPTVRLADGSTVTLNAGSTLRYFADSSSPRRDVDLSGEAYFSVVHDAARPFQVHANGTTIRDVGTRFVVRAYDATTTVVVAEGAVAVRRDATTSRDSTLLTRGMMARVSASGAIATSSANPAQFIAFADGHLVLDDVSLNEAARMLGRWYDATVVVTDTALGHRRVSADFRDESLSDAVASIALSLGAEVHVTGRTATFVPRPAGR